MLGKLALKLIYATIDIESHICAQFYNAPPTNPRTARAIRLSWSSADSGIVGRLTTIGVILSDMGT